jgi:hypothetical protein
MSGGHVWEYVSQCRSEVRLTGPTGIVMESVPLNGGLSDVTVPTKVASPSTDVTTVI